MFQCSSIPKIWNKPQWLGQTTIVSSCIFIIHKSSLYALCKFQACPLGRSLKSDALCWRLVASTPTDTALRSSRRGLDPYPKLNLNGVIEWSSYILILSLYFVIFLLGWQLLEVIAVKDQGLYLCYIGNKEEKNNSDKFPTFQVSVIRCHNLTFQECKSLNPHELTMILSVGLMNNFVETSNGFCGLALCPSTFDCCGSGQAGKQQPLRIYPEVLHFYKHNYISVTSVYCTDIIRYSHVE